jgi:hypothetical protein
MQINRPRRYRRATAAWVFVAVIIMLAVIVVRGPARFFQASSVQSDASCMVRHCATSTTQAPNGQSWPREPQTDR